MLVRRRPRREPQHAQADVELRLTLAQAELSGLKAERYCYRLTFATVHCTSGRKGQPYAGRLLGMRPL